MRKIVMLFFAVALVAGMAVLAHADEMIKGQVVSIDPEGKTIVIKTGEGEKTVIFQETTTGFKEVKPGQSVEMTCIDMGGKSCAKDIKIISITEAQKPTRTFEGKVVSIDPEGKTVVIKSSKGEEMTIVVKGAQPAMIEKTTVTEGVVTTAPATMEEITPGMPVMVDCFDSEGKFCATRLTIISSKEAVTGMEVMGEVTSIDPTGKAIVIKTETGEKTVFFLPGTTGLTLDQVTVGKRVKAFCLDVSGKSCVRDIKVEEAK